MDVGESEPIARTILRLGKLRLVRIVGEMDDGTLARAAETQAGHE